MIISSPYLARLLTVWRFPRKPSFPNPDLSPRALSSLSLLRRNPGSLSPGNPVSECLSGLLQSMKGKAKGVRRAATVSGDGSSKVRRKPARLTQTSRSVSAPSAQVPVVQEPMSKGTAFLCPDKASNGKITISTAVFDPLNRGPITGVCSPVFDPSVGLNSANSEERSWGEGSGDSDRGVRGKNTGAKHAIGTNT